MEWSAPYILLFISRTLVCFDVLCTILHKLCVFFVLLEDVYRYLRLNNEKKIIFYFNELKGNNVDPFRFYNFFHPQLSSNIRISYIQFHLFTCTNIFANSQYDQFLVGLIAQLVEHCNGIARVMVWNAVQA